MTYDFETFRYTRRSDAAAIMDWIKDRCPRIKQPVEVEVRIVVGGSAAKASAETVELVMGKLLSWGPTVWTEDEYNFDFRKRLFLWRGEPIHITAGEAAFLYRLLIQQKRDGAEVFYVRHLTRRFGKDFLGKYL
jgi:hypothetical protein